MHQQTSAVPTVSILIAAFNAGAFIARAIDSALNQSGVSCEVIVVDDASTDDTVTVVQGIARTEPRLRIVESARNGGPGAARNLGIDAARGEWIAILDADDTMEPDRCARLLAVAHEWDAQLVADNWCEYDRASDVLGPPVLRRQVPEVQLISRHAYVEGARPYGPEPDFGLMKPIINRAYLRAHALRYPDSVRHGEDFEFVFSVLQCGARYVLARDIAGYRYTTRASGWSRTKVDDAGLIARTRLLRQRSDVRRDRVLVTLIAERVRALRRLELDRMLAIGGRGDIGRTLRRAVQTPQGWRWMAGHTKLQMMRLLSAGRV